MTTRMLTPELLLHAYGRGIFPMAESRRSSDLFWVDPRRRGVLPLDGFHISRSLRRRILNASYQVVLNADFAATVAACADRPETWINDTLAGLYDELHAMGCAHSLELYEGGALVGGTFGISMGGAWFGESMFSRRTDASKIVLAYLVDRLRLTGFSLFDTQFITDHLATLGGQEITRSDYQTRLGDALGRHADITRVVTQTPQEVLQRNAQTS